MLFRTLDYNGGDIWRERTKTADECGHRCNENKDCKRWTFATYEHYGKCYIKKFSKTQLTPCLQCISGFRNSSLIKCGETGGVIMPIYNLGVDISF